jgi:hypothetical protein
LAEKLVRTVDEMYDHYRTRRSISSEQGPARAMPQP